MRIEACYNLIMSWFNFWGLIIIILILIPNIFSVVLDKSSFENKFDYKPIMVLEQIGRYLCLSLMIFNIPYTYFGFWFNNALYIYIAVNIILIIVYYLGWIIFRKSKCAVKMLWLSIIPTIIFLFSGIMVSSIPLIAAALIFGVGHITISYKNSD